jgi:hypothetical protein
MRVDEATNLPVTLLDSVPVANPSGNAGQALLGLRGARTAPGAVTVLLELAVWQILISVQAPRWSNHYLPHPRFQTRAEAAMAVSSEDLENE